MESFLNEIEVSEKIRVSLACLRRWRLRGEGPQYVMGVYSWSMAFGHLISLKLESGCSANKPAENPEPFHLAFYTHSALKWFRD
jgi:hypothetical protein